MKKILLIEDDPDVSQNVKYMLFKAGYMVYLAQNGVEGIEMAKLHQPNLILLDLMLPLKNGEEVVTAVKQFPQCAQTPIICLTGLVNAQENQAPEMIKMGSQEYPAFAKPFDLSSLLKTIEKALSPDSQTDRRPT